MHVTKFSPNQLQSFCANDLDLEKEKQEFLLQSNDHNWNPCWNPHREQRYVLLVAGKLGARWPEENKGGWWS